MFCRFSCCYSCACFGLTVPLLLLNKLLSGKYVGNRPIKLRKSNWKERTDVEALERQKVPSISFYFLLCPLEFHPFFSIVQNHVQRKPKIPKKGILHK